ncbi:Pyridoxal 5'-phosphate synthase subunit PdxT [Chlamydiales bacterium SCGC AG-110-M15]|nr:Pyridoxal 5'-phosphate synthase subunit PdxT [Chlamydiales bacterium SCGC AG-110-M15]
MNAVVGVLALQGAFAKHLKMMQSLGVHCVEVRTAEELNECDGLIIPGGESTTMAKLLSKGDLWDPLRQFSSVKPIFGTCAGMILMANEVVGDFDYPSLGLLDITVRRNAYGRQTESFSSQIAVDLGKGLVDSFHGIFIRAPRLETWGSKMDILAKWEEVPVLIRKGLHLGASFHPELTNDPMIHRYFLDIVLERVGVL